jgi:hypothetical protein
MPQEIGSIALRQAGGLVGALRDGFAFITPGDDALEWIGNPEPDPPMNRLNDGRAHRQGRFWAGSMHDSEGPPRTCFEREPVEGEGILSSYFDKLSMRIRFEPGTKSPQSRHRRAALRGQSRACPVREERRCVV